MNPMTGVFHGFDIVSSALRAEMQRAEIVAANLANIHVTGPDGPYRRKSVVFEEYLADGQRGLAAELPGAQGLASGVQIREVYEDHLTPFFEEWAPAHPHANEQGFVLRSNVNLFKEMVDMAVIERSFQANLAAMRSYRAMVQSTLSNFAS